MIWYDMIWFYLHKIAALRPNYNVQYKTREDKTTHNDQKQSLKYSNRQQRNKAKLWSRRAKKKIESKKSNYGSLLLMLKYLFRDANFSPGNMCLGCFFESMDEPNTPSCHSSGPRWLGKKAWTQCALDYVCWLPLRNHKSFTFFNFRLVLFPHISFFPWKQKHLLYNLAACHLICLLRCQVETRNTTFSTYLGTMINTQLISQLALIVISRFRYFLQTVLKPESMFLPIPTQPNGGGKGGGITDFEKQWHFSTFHN